MTGEDFVLPRHLKVSTRRWAEDILATYELEGHHFRLLVLAAEAWDRGQAARARIARLGMTYQDRFKQPRLRPEVNVERDSRVAFARLVRELALDVLEPGESRPPVIQG